MVADAPGLFVLCSIAILAACMFVAWRRAGKENQDLRGNLFWALAGASTLNLALAALWFFPSWAGGPAIFVLGGGLPYLAGLMLSKPK